MSDDNRIEKELARQEFTQTEIELINRGGLSPAFIMHQRMFCRMIGCKQRQAKKKG